MTEQEKHYETICEEIRAIKFKYWTPPEEKEGEEITNKITEDLKKTSINFYKGDIKTIFEKSGRKVACIAFPSSSIYTGYVWFYPAEWIRENKDNAEKRWTTIKDKFNIVISKSEKDNTGKFKTVDVKEITPQELKEAMKRPQK